MYEIVIAMESNQEASHDQIDILIKDNTSNNGEENTYQIDMVCQVNSIENCIQNKPNDLMVETETLKDKAYKKRLKKEKKKLKKIEKTNQIKESNINTTETIQVDVKELEITKELSTNSFATISANVNQDKDIKDNSNANNDSVEEIDFSNNTSAFVLNAVRKNNKIISKKESNRHKEDDTTKVNLRQTSLSSETLNNDNDEYNDIGVESDFTLVKYKNSKHPNNLRSSQDFATAAIKLILENHITQSIQYLSTAINLDPNNVYHFANRSFCYLRVGKPCLAIKDATFVIKNTSNNTILAKANYLLAKAYHMLKNYEEAEKNIQRCLNLFPNNLSYIRESVYFKISQLVNMGFCETEGLLALKNHTSITDAIETLINVTNMPKTNNDGVNDYDASLMSYDETEIFYSDDEDNCSNTQLLSSIIEKKLINNTKSLKKQNKM